MDTEQPRYMFAIGGVAGAAVFGLHTLVTAWLAGQTPTRQDLIRAAVNVLAAMIAGGLCAYFLGPVIAARVPQQLRDAMAWGFAIGFFTWEGVPIVLGAARRFAEKKTKSIEEKV